MTANKKDHQKRLGKKVNQIIALDKLRTKQKIGIKTRLKKSLYNFLLQEIGKTLQTKTSFNKPSKKIGKIMRRDP